MHYWHELTYRNKNRLLWVATAVFLLLAYRVSIAPTVEAYSHYRRLTEQSLADSHAPGRLAGLRRELEQAEGFLAPRPAGGGRTDPLLAGLTPLCQRFGVRMEALPPARTEVREACRVTTRLVRLEGRYADLLQVVYRLERRLRVGRLASVRFAVREDLLRGTRRLYAECHLQQVHPE